MRTAFFIALGGVEFCMVNNISLGQAKAELLRLLECSIKQKAPKQEFALLFSGGIDSVLLALLFKKLGLKFTCFFGFVEGVGQPKDLAFAKKAASFLDVPLVMASVSFDDLQSLARDAVYVIGSSNPVQVGVALPLLISCRNASASGHKFVFSGMGADELFCGYAKFRNSKNVVLDSLKLVQQLPEKDLKRDEAIANVNGLRLRTPFLDAELLKFALSLPKKLKLSKDCNKVILRELAKDLGLPEELVARKKTAAQYGSNFDKALGKLAKKRGFRGKSDYLASFAREKNLRVASLFSGGKDSCLSLWIMQRQNYGVKCLVSILPENPDSFMYQKPSLGLLELQSKALGIPLVVEKTPGVKERELSALKKALSRAKKEFGVEGVVSGALYSNYQRERIQRICNSLGLKLFSPLWHKSQSAEMRELVDNGFVFVMSKVAALGLAEGWLGKPIGKGEISRLESLESRFGFNVAGEGGEFETIVLDAPNFSGRIVLKRVEKRMENEFTGSIIVKSAVLEAKK